MTGLSQIARMRSAASMPSMVPSRRTSIKTRSGFFSSAKAIPLSACEAVPMTQYPRRLSLDVRSAATIASSSMIRILAFGKGHLVVNEECCVPTSELSVLSCLSHSGKSREGQPVFGPLPVLNIHLSMQLVHEHLHELEAQSIGTSPVDVMGEASAIIAKVHLHNFLRDGP